MFVFLLCLVFPMMLESLFLDCPFVVAPSVFSYVYCCYQHPIITIFFVLRGCCNLYFMLQERGIRTLRPTYLSHILSVSYVFYSSRTPKCHHLIGLLLLADKLGVGGLSEYKILVCSRSISILENICFNYCSFDDAFYLNFVFTIEIEDFHRGNL